MILRRTSQSAPSLGRLYPWRVRRDVWIRLRTWRCRIPKSRTNRNWVPKRQLCQAFHHQRVTRLFQSAPFQPAWQSQFQLSFLTSLPPATGVLLRTYSNLEAALSRKPMTQADRRSHLPLTRQRRIVAISRCKDSRTAAVPVHNGPRPVSRKRRTHQPPRPAPPQGFF